MVGQAASSIPGIRVHQVLDLAIRRLGRRSRRSTFDTQQAADKVTGTPTLFVGKSGTKGKQVPLQSPTDEQSLVTALEQRVA